MKNKIEQHLLTGTIDALKDAVRITGKESVIKHLINIAKEKSHFNYREIGDPMIFSIVEGNSWKCFYELELFGDTLRYSCDIHSNWKFTVDSVKLMDYKFNSFTENPDKYLERIITEYANLLFKHHKI